MTVTLSDDQIDTLPPKVKHLILNHPNGITQDDLATLLEVDTRTVRLAIRELTEQGEVIVSDTSGFRYAECMEDVTAYVNRLRAGIRSQAERVNSIIASGNRKFAGQVPLIEV